MRPDKSVQHICNVRKQNCFHDWKSTLNMIGNVMCIKKSGIYCYSLKIIKWWVLIESNLFLLLHTWPSQTNAQIDRKNSLSYLQFLWHPFLNHLWSLNLTYFTFTHLALTDKWTNWRKKLPQLFTIFITSILKSIVILAIW